MKKILYIIALVALAACSSDDDFQYQTGITGADVKLLKLRADHATLLPDGKATMKFYAKAYGIDEFADYTPTYIGDSAVYIPSTSRDTFLIPSSKLPEGLIRLYDSEGNEYPNFEYATTDTTQRNITFHLVAGELESEPITIRTRALPQTNYEDIVIPVVFHVLQPAEQAGVANITIDEETIDKNIERLNNVFQGLVTTDPNGCNAHITFRAAQYNQNGVPMSEPGVNRYEVPSSVTLSSEDDYQTYIMSKAGKLMYDYKNYLNIWLYNYPAGNSAVVKTPNVIDDAANAIPGLTAGTIDSDFPERPTDVGILINMSYFLNPAYQTDYYEISSSVAQYLGLLSCQISVQAGDDNRVNGDVDYCDDTYSWWDDGSSVFKTTGEDESDPTAVYFTSYHVMDRYSYKNSVTVDQVARIRQVLEHCPSRWMWKSKFAFTGKEEDRK